MIVWLTLEPLLSLNGVGISLPRTAGSIFIFTASGAQSLRHIENTMSKEGIVSFSTKRKIIVSRQSVVQTISDYRLTNYRC